MITSIGNFLRKLRLKHQQILKDMANVLNVTSSFLSAVENGKKNMPPSWYPILESYYSLSYDEMETLHKSALESQKNISINIQNLNNYNRQLALSFAREFENIDEDTSKQLLSILENRHKRGKKV